MVGSFMALTGIMLHTISRLLNESKRQNAESK